MKKIVLLFIILTFATKNYSQDTLLMKDGTRILCKIDKDDGEKVFFSFFNNNVKINSYAEKNTVKEIRKRADNTVFYIEFGLGRYGGFNNVNNTGMNMLLSLNSKINKFYYKIQYISCQEKWFGDDKSNSTNDLGILIGKAISKEKIQISLNIGLGIVWGNDYRSFYETYTYPYTWGKKKEVQNSIFTIGIPIELDIKIKPFKNFGLGCSIVGNANDKMGYIGLIFKGALGNLRGK